MIYYLSWRINFNEIGWIEILNFSQDKNPFIKYTISKKKYTLVSDLILDANEPNHIFNTRITISSLKDNLIYFVLFENSSINTGVKTYEIRLTGSKPTLTKEIKSYMCKNFFMNYILDPNDNEYIVDNNIKELKKNNSANFVDKFNNNVYIIAGTKNQLFE